MSKDVPEGWPWKGSGKPPSALAKRQLAHLSDRKLRAMMQTARKRGGSTRVGEWEFSVAQLTAALKKDR